jgi:hypothetical protein
LLLLFLMQWNVCAWWCCCCCCCFVGAVSREGSYIYITLGLSLLAGFNLRKRQKNKFKVWTVALTRRRDIQHDGTEHNDTRHTDTQHNGLNCDVQESMALPLCCVIRPSVIMLSDVFQNVEVPMTLQVFSASYTVIFLRTLLLSLSFIYFLAFVYSFSLSLSLSLSLVFLLFFFPISFSHYLSIPFSSLCVSLLYSPFCVSSWTDEQKDREAEGKMDRRTDGQT